MPPLGRPRTFDREEKLRIAVKLFCERGFEGVSIADLTQAMAISPPSLYAAFGTKEALYREALECYQRHKAQFAATCTGSFRERLRTLLRDSVRAATEADYPAGCMVVAGMLSCAVAHRPLAATLSELRRAQCEGFAEQLQAAVAEGELPAATDIPAMSRYLTALVQGIAIQARDGAPQAELFAMVEVAISCFPAAPDSC